MCYNSSRFQECGNTNECLEAFYPTARLLLSRNVAQMQRTNFKDSTLIKMSYLIKYL
jgi:hypothetical protein